MKTTIKALRIFSNKYLIALLAFAFLMLFVDHNDIFIQLDRKKQLKDLLESKRFYKQEIAKTKAQLADLQNNPSAIEKYAREKYYMKRDNEDLFIVQQGAEAVKKQ